MHADLVRVPILTLSYHMMNRQKPPCDSYHTVVTWTS